MFFFKLLFNRSVPCDPLTVLICYWRYIHSKNRAGLSYSLALNSLSDRTMSELATMRGRKQGKTPNRGLAFPIKMYEGVKVPESLDWRLYGVYEPKIFTNFLSVWQNLKFLS